MKKSKTPTLAPDEPLEPFDIYVRHSGDSNLLMFHGALRSPAITEATLAAGKPLAYLELIILPEGRVP